MMQVLYSCPFVPVELISAAGLQPQRVSEIAQNTPCRQTEGICFYVQTVLHTLKQQVEPYAAVFTTTCDQMRRAFDWFIAEGGQNGFLLHVPAVITDQSIDTFSGELQRLMTFLNQLPKTGVSSSKQPFKPEIPANSSRKIALLGGPVLSEHYQQFGCVLGSRAAIILDATETALSQHRSHFVLSTDTQQGYRQLAEHYLRHTPSIRMRPGGLFMQWLADRFKQQPVDGILIVRQPFCDHWRGIEIELRQQFGLPVLVIDLDGTGTLTTAAVTRLQAFLEILG